MVNLQEIKTAIADREEEITQKWTTENIIERELYKKAKSLLSHDTALVITGVRRCGKSMFAFMLGKENNCAYVNFEDERLLMNAAELNIILEAIYSLKGNVDLLIFDEIQNITGWEQFVSRLTPNKKIIITGSNARLLSKELATYLTGRHIDVTLFPFSFREYLKFNNIEINFNLTKNIAQLKNSLEDYLSIGGFPLTAKLGKIFLLEAYRDILERDIIQRHKIIEVKAFKDLAKYLISNTSCEFTCNKLKNIFGIKSAHTIKNYISYMESAYLIFTLERFSFKLKKQGLAPKKVYCIDAGLANTIGFTTSENHGKIMENAVAIELLRKVSSDPNIELYYWKNAQQEEVDFVIKEGLKIKELLQVCFKLDNQNTKQRELKALVKASEELKCNNLLVINDNYDAEETIENKKIKFIPLWKWLLEQ